MSPEYTGGWMDVPKQTRNEIKSNLPSGVTKQDVFNDGAVLEAKPDNRMIYKPFESATQKDKDKARKNGHVHLIYPKAGTSPRQKDFEDITLEEAEKRRGHTPGKYRGNHRTDLKQTGRQARWRSGKISRL